MSSGVSVRWAMRKVSPQGNPTCFASALSSSRKAGRAVG